MKKKLITSSILISMLSTVVPTYADAILSTNMQQIASSNADIITPNDNEIKQVTDTLLFVNGELTDITEGIYNYKSSTYLPMRKLGELLDANVEWFSNEKVAQLTLNGITLEILNKTNKSVVINNGNIIEQQITATVENKDISLPALNVNGSVYLPMRYIATTLGVEINYDNPHPETRTKTITVGQRTGLDYKLPETPQGVHPINVGKTPKAPDGVDYNAKYLDYLLQKKQFTDKAGNATPVPEADFNKLFSQSHPKTGAKAIPGLFFIDGGLFWPVFDHDGDGKIGDAKISDLSITDLDNVRINYNKESKKSQALSKGLYTFNTYNHYTYDGQFMNWFIKGEYVGPNK